MTIQEARTSASQAFFDWLQKDLPVQAKKFKEDAAKAFDQASGWANQKADELKNKVEEVKKPHLPDVD